MRPRIYFARAIEGIARSDIIRLAKDVQEDFDAADLTLVDANLEYHRWRDNAPLFEPDDEYRVIVNFQLDLLRSCDGMLVDMTIPNRNYVGCCSELVYAYQFQIPAAVYVGETDNDRRTWLRFHAQFVATDRTSAIAHLIDALANEGDMR